MGGQIVVSVRSEAMVPLARLDVGIDVHHDRAHVREVVQELMPDLLGHIVARFDGQASRHGHAEVDVEAMADPAGAHVGQLLDAGDVGGRV